MSTPFEFFRRNQKVALAAVTGMAILSFLVADAASNQGRMSGPAVAVLFTGCLAIFGWISGVKENKSRENALFGIVLGLAVSLIFMFFGRQTNSITASSGSISSSQLEMLSRNRMLANRMVTFVHRNANPKDLNQRGPQLFNHTGTESERELVVTQLLLREADKFGIQVDREAALNYLKQIAGEDESGVTRLTKSVYNQSLEETVAAAHGVSEATVLKAIQEELRARTASVSLFGSARTSPQSYWDLHRKMAVRQSSHYASIPVAAFFDKTEPGDAELKELFAAHRENYPNFTAKGELQPGLPGFALQRREKLVYLEPDYEALEKQVPAITEEEILKRYEERHKTAVPARPEEMLPELPELPNVPVNPAETKPAEEAATPEPPKTDPPTPSTESPPAPEAQPVKPSTPEQPAESPAPTPETKPDAAPQPESPATEQPQSSLNPRNSRLQLVAMQAEEPAAPAAGAPADPAPEAKPTAEEKPAAVPPTPPTDKPAEEKPATETPPSTETPPAPSGSTPLTVPAIDAEGDPAPPSSSVRPLDEELKQTIRDELLREKTEPLKQEKVAAARDYMTSLSERVQEYLDHQKAENKADYPLNEHALTPEKATQQLKEFAEKNGYSYGETPLSSYGELVQSEDHSIGLARIGRESSVADMTFRSSNNLFVTYTAENFSTGANFAFWKTEDIDAHNPETIDEPGVRDAVIKAWRTQKARPLAEKRATELADLIRKSDKPIEETLAEQTVNGQPASLFVTVQATGDYQWITTGGGFGMPRAGDILGIPPQEIDEAFRTKLFDEMKPGDVAALPNADRSAYYVMKIDSRSHQTEAEQETLRKEFVSSSNFMTSFILQMTLNQTEQQALSQQFVQRLEERHGVSLNR